MLRLSEVYKGLLIMGLFKEICGDRYNFSLVREFALGL